MPRRSDAIVAAARSGAWIAALAAFFVTACGPEKPRKRIPPRRTRGAPAAVTLPPRVGPSPVRFVDDTADSGVRFDQVNGYGDGGWYYVETYGSGVVFFDADGDADPDLFFCNGTHLTGGGRGDAPSDAFFRNDGHGRFVDATAESGLRDSSYTMGACAGDCDNDGDLDLYVTNFDERNVLWRNDGSGCFEDATECAGVPGRADGVDGACAFADVDGDGWLDLYVGGCVDHTRTKNRTCLDYPYERGELMRRYCNPVDYAPLPDLLYRNRGDGTFEDASTAAGVATLGGRTLGLAFCDFDDDGDQDLFVANERSANHLLVNDGHGHFHDVAAEAGVDVDADGIAQAGMGVSAGDWDGDGRMDLVVTYYEREPNGLLRNEAGESGECGLAFVECAGKAGTANPSYLRLGWGTELFDADLDGRLDWLVMAGHVHPKIAELRPPEKHNGYAQLPLFFLNRGDGFFESLREEAGPALADRHTARGLATADVDGDGDLDVAINNNHSPATLWRNDSPRDGRHWLIVRTIGAMRPGGACGSNRDAIGARITLHLGGQKLLREVHSAQSYFSQSDLRAHFGLGAATVVDRLEVRWPSGRLTRLEGVPADQVLTVEEPAKP